VKTIECKLSRQNYFVGALLREGSEQNFCLLYSWNWVFARFKM